MNTKIENLLTMPDGIDNPKWGEAALLCQQIATAACELRGRLEELQELAEQEEIILTNEGDEHDSYDIQDWATQVAEIEDVFFIDDSKKEE